MPILKGPRRLDSTPTSVDWLWKDCSLATTQYPPGFAGCASVFAPCHTIWTKPIRPLRKIGSTPNKQCVARPHPRVEVLLAVSDAHEKEIPRPKPFFE